MLNEKIIAALEAKGFKRWTKGNMDRLYINPENLGLEVSLSKSGRVSGAYLNGEQISNTRGAEMKASKTYIDVKTGEVMSTNYTMETAATELYEQTLSEIEAADAPDTDVETIENDTELTGMSDQALADFAAEQNARLTHENTWNKAQNVSADEREAILDTLHSIRLELWRRGFNVPTEADKPDIERHLESARKRLERANATGRLEMIYAQRNRVRTNEDKLAWIG